MLIVKLGARLFAIYFMLPSSQRVSGRRNKQSGSRSSNHNLKKSPLKPSERGNDIRKVSDTFEGHDLHLHSSHAYKKCWNLGNQSNQRQTCAKAFDRSYSMG